MEPIFIVATTLVCMVLLKVVFKVNKKKAEPLKEDKELETLTDRFPENVDIAKEMLEMLDNKNVKIEEGLLMQGPINEQELKNWLKKIGLIK